MRVLTTYEKEQFDIAFKHISSLAVMHNERTELYMLRHGNDWSLTIPRAYFDLSDAVGGFSKMLHLFCNLYKESATKWLIDYCFKNKVQPSSFEIIGSVNKINISHSYSHKEIKYGDTE